VASFYDSNVTAPATAFTATIGWGDGSTATVSGAAGNIVAVGNGYFYLLAAHAYPEEGNFTLSVQVNDVSGSSISGSQGLRVADARLPALGVANLQATHGHSTGTVTVATFSDLNAAAPAADFTAVINWGDGSTTTVSGAGIVSEGSGNFAVLASHLYGTAGSVTLSVTVDDVGGSSAFGQRRITVA
jgi:hypothetical protein